MEDAVPWQEFETMSLTTVEGEQPVSESILEPAIIPEHRILLATA